MKIEKKIEALQERSDNLLKEINDLCNENKLEEANALYNGEFTKVNKEIITLSNKLLATF